MKLSYIFASVSLIAAFFLGYATKTVISELHERKTGSGDREKQVTLHLNVTPPNAPGVATINGHPLSFNVVADGKSQTIVVPTDAPLELAVESSGYKKMTRDLSIDSATLNGQRDYTFDIELEALNTGTLTVKTSVSADATISDAAKKIVWSGTSPFHGVRLPAGTYHLDLANKKQQLRRSISVEIKENQQSQPYDDDDSSKTLILSPTKGVAVNK